ncbi:PspC domain-containing protein [Flagellimonas olearia]|uniref:PspC domain-containing protein n=1 Tax=Flagellimonas olearia TaxID=552546 RepID=A0A6I1E304_9FLAO|nr:PspC domain-containing protein [Allomuricauda olearia]KAB7530331.1 PspC domain-containing protein [Allomuricauda olearia]
MDSENITGFFTRPEKSILGVCSTVSNALKIPTVGIRVALIVLTLLFIPLGLIAYLGLYLVFNKRMGKMVTFGLLGALLGIPLSYYFQSGIIQNYGGNGGVLNYLRNFIAMVDEYDRYVGNGWDVVFNMFLSIIVFALVGGVIGYYLDKHGKVNNKPLK